MPIYDHESKVERTLRSDTKKLQEQRIRLRNEARTIIEDAEGWILVAACPVFKENPEDEIITEAGEYTKEKGEQIIRDYGNDLFILGAEKKGD